MRSRHASFNRPGILVPVLQSKRSPTEAAKRRRQASLQRTIHNASAIDTAERSTLSLDFAKSAVPRKHADETTRKICFNSLEQAINTTQTKPPAFFKAIQPIINITIEFEKKLVLCPGLSFSRMALFHLADMTKWYQRLLVT